MKIGVVGRKGGPSASSGDLGNKIAIFVLQALNDNHFIFLDKDTVSSFNLAGFCITSPNVSVLDNVLFDQAEAIVVFGGDGTMLDVAKTIAANELEIPLIGVNHGRVGFITDLPGDCSYTEIINVIKTGRVENRSLLVVCSRSNGNMPAYALNDIVIRSDGRLLKFQVFLNGHFAYQTRADGLIISTPTGSTAYAMSAGGSIIPPAAEVIEIIPMLPQTLSYRPLIVPNCYEISVRIDAGTGFLFADGVDFGKIALNSAVEIEIAETKAKFIHPETYDYFETLRSKLNWHLEPGK
jgi:NAD+ kinase